MSSSSQQPDSSITLNDTYTIDLSGINCHNTYNSDTITLTGYNPCVVSYPSYYSSPSISTITTTQIAGLTTAQLGAITSIDTSSFTINFPEEWVNCFPDFKRIEKMCEEYPGLKIAYEKFVTTYKLVTDHYDTPKDKRPKP
jgi:hypothetical protein